MSESHKSETDKENNYPGIWACGVYGWSGEIIIVFIIQSSSLQMVNNGKQILFLNVIQWHKVNKNLSRCNCEQTKPIQWDLVSESSVAKRMPKQLKSLKKRWLLTRLKKGGVQPGVEVRYVIAVRLYQGDHAMFAWHNKTLKPQLKGNIWRKALYVSQSEGKRVRDTHRKRWWINRREKLSKRIQAESSCEDLTIPDGVCKTARDGEQWGGLCVCVFGP